MPHTRLIHILEQLSFLGNVVERRMFGGYGLYLEGFFFGLIDREGKLFLKTDQSNCDEFLAVGGVKFQPDSEKKPMNYCSVPDDLVDGSGKIQSWAQRAVTISRLAKEAKESPLKKMRNLGETSVVWLLDIGLHSAEELKQIGAVAAFRSIRDRGHKPSMNLLWALDGAISGTLWSRLPKERKAELEKELGS